MTESAILPPEEVSRRIVVSIGLVYDLFGEMNTLFRLLREGLEEAGAGISVRGGKGYALRRGKKHVTVADRFVRTDMGMFATIGDARPDEEVVEEDEDAEEAGEDEDDSAVDRAQVAIAPETKFLGVRAVLYDRSLKDPLAFTPTLIAGVFTAISRRARGQQDREISFGTKGANVKRLVKLLEPGMSADTLVGIRIPRYELNARVGLVHEAPLASIGSEADLQQFIDAVVELIDRVKT